MTRATLVLVLAANLCGCGSPTELMLIIKAATGLSSGAGGDVDALRVSVQRANGDPQVFTYSRSVALCATAEQGQPDCRPQRYADESYDKALTLPVRFLLQPGELEQNEPVRVWVDAQLGSKVRIANGLKFLFAPGHRLWLELPLYRECLGVVACQAEDKICGVDRDCTDVQPTTEPPPGIDQVPNDLAGLFNNPDAAQSCGAVGMSCCQGEVCATGAVCNPSGYCIDPGQVCGQQSQPCCQPAGACQNGLTCSNGVCITSCGDTAQACCGAAPSCNKGADKCIAGVCTPCGDIQQRCCPGPSCTSSNAICDESNTCIPCGDTGERCCDNDVCISGKCGTSSDDMSMPFDLYSGKDFSVSPFDLKLGDGFTSLGDMGAQTNNAGTNFGPGAPLAPQGGGVPAGPPRYCY